MFGASVLLLSVVIIELGIRLSLYVWRGFNPFYVTFGFVVSVEPSSHSDRRLGYSKFKPNQVKHMKYTEKTIPVRINSDGFRGGEDFVRPKP